MAKNFVGTVYLRKDVEAILQEKLPKWFFEEEFIKREFKTGGWRTTLMILNAVGHLSEVAWHHPKLIVTYDNLEIRLNTHDADGITDRDFALAEKIEEVLAWAPQDTLDTRLTGIPDDPRYKYIVD